VVSESDRPIRDAPPPARRAIAGRLVFLLVTLVSLYVLWPSLLKVFSAWPELLTLNPGWFVVMFLAELASYGCIWALQRLALRTQAWRPVITAHLAGNAFSRIVPGGAAAGGAIQYRFLVQDGVPATTVGAALTTAGLISTATLFALPVLALPAMLAGRPVPSGLAQAAWLGVVVFVLAVGTGALLITTDGLLRVAGRAIQAVRNRLHRKDAPTTDLPDRLVAERDAVRHTLGARWWQALLAALGNWLFDYLALLAALAAVGSRPRPTLVLLAYVASMVLAMIPLTPGGLGFVEAGLTATLTLAHVAPADAVLATLAYRLVSYWLPLPAGLVAAALHRRRFDAATA
jgi:putative heme transporter